MENVDNFHFYYPPFPSNLRGIFNLLGIVSKLKKVFESYEHISWGNDGDDVYNYPRINDVLSEFVRNSLQDGKIITVLNVYTTIHNSFGDISTLFIFDPLILFIFILRQTLHPSQYYENNGFPSFLSKYPSNFWTNFGLYGFCDSCCKDIKNPLSVIVRCFFSKGIRNTWLKLDEIKLLTEIFNDYCNREEESSLGNMITADDCDEVNEKGYLDDMIDFMLEWKNNLEEEIIWKELFICVISQIYIRIIKSKDDIYISRLKKRIDDKNVIPRILSLKITLTSEN
jgi:hypothetical protein